MSSKTQTPSPLSPFDETTVLSEAQWNTLSAVVDTIISPVTLFPATQSPVTQSPGAVGVDHQLSYAAAVNAIKSNSGLVDEALISEYLAESATSCPGFKDAIYRFMALQIDSDMRKRFLGVLDALNDPRTSWLLTGHLKPFAQLSANRREKVIQSWSTARLQVYRVLFGSFTTIVKAYWARTSPTLGRILSYPHTPINHSYGPGFEFPFVLFPPLSQESAPVPSVIETDVLVVGSGCTGAVAASFLARCGLDVLVTEKGNYWKPQHLPMSEKEGFHHLFDNGGVTVADGGKMSILAGSCFGGGGTVNWSASLQLRPFVRREFASKHGLPYFESAAFQNDMDVVCETMGVGTQAIQHNPGNQMLLDGAKMLGLSAKSVPQNTGGEAHNCGYCTFGCGSCGKKGPTESWLPDAARHGAKFIEGFRCEKIIFADQGTEGGERRAIGAQGFWTSRDGHGGVAGERYTRRVIIHTRRAVVVAAGALGGSSMLLQRSGIVSPHLGKHLKLHPTNSVFGIFDRDIMPWEGGILTAVVNEYENIDNSGYGVKLEGICMLPGLVMPLFHWYSALDWKLFASKFKRTAGWISLARDESEGIVYADPTDKYRARVSYDVSKSDQGRIATGLIGLAKIAYVEGAREIHVSVPGVPPFERRQAVKEGSSAIQSVRSEKESGEQAISDDPSFKQWLSRLEKFAANGMPAEASQGSAHQMGTARMGTSPKNSVVDPRGRVWNTNGVYVADTSVLPGASGVNPMITGMAVARGIARNVADDLGVLDGSTTTTKPRL